MIFNRKTNYIIPVKLRKWPLKFTHCGVHSVVLRRYLGCTLAWEFKWFRWSSTPVICIGFVGQLLHWFISQRQASETGSGGNHHVVVPTDTSRKSLEASRGHRSSHNDVQLDRNGCREPLFPSELETVRTMCLLRWCPPLWLVVPLNRMNCCQSVDESQCSSL